MHGLNSCATIVRVRFTFYYSVNLILVLKNPVYTIVLVLSHILSSQRTLNVEHTIHILTLFSMYVCMYVCICVYVCMYVCMYVYVCIYARECVCIKCIIYIYIYIYIVEEGLDGHGLLLLRVSDDRITRETLSNNNPCPSSPSSTILRSAYMALNTLQQDWLL